MFNGGRIRSVRIYWDQATVLKQLEIVGARGRGWPITDGSHQIDLITKTSIIFSGTALTKQLYQKTRNLFKRQKVNCPL